MISSTPALGRDQVTLSPTTPWGLEYSEDSCTIRRLFGEGDERVQLELRQFSPRSSFQITVMSAAMRSTKRAAKFRFEPSTEWRKITAPLYATIGKDLEGVIFSAEILPDQEEEDEGEPGEIDFALRALEDETFDQITGISINGAFSNDLTLQTEPLEAVHAAMKTCLFELTTHWGIDAEAHRSLTRRAAPSDYKSMVRDMLSHYPSRMLQRGMPGLVRVRLAVDSAGKVTDCHVQLNITDPVFQETACKILSTKPFKPALDKDGNAIDSYWATGITYTTGG